MVALDVGRAVAAARLHNVGIERALHEEGLAARFVAVHDALLAQNVFLGLFKHANELAANDLALLLGVGHARECGKEPFFGIDHDELRTTGRAAEGALNFFGFAKAHEAVVDVHAREAIADRTLDEGRGNGGVDAAAQGTDRGAVFTDLGADQLDLFVDDVRHRPFRLDAGAAVEEVLEDFLAALGVLDFGVPLDAEDAPFAILECGNGRARRNGDHVEAFGGFVNAVAVAHPHVLVEVLIGKQNGIALDFSEQGRAVLASARGGDRASKGLRDCLEAVAQAEHRNTRVEESGVEFRGAVGIHGAGAAGEDERFGVLREDFARAHRVRDDLGVNVRFADPARDELRVLRTKIDDEDRILLGAELVVVHHALHPNARTTGPPHRRAWGARRDRARLWHGSSARRRSSARGSRRRT